MDVLGDNVDTLAKDPNLKLGISLAQEYHPKRHCIVVSVHEIDDPFFPRLWGLLLGDTVHNFRSALDHLAWALYKRGRTPNLSAKRERNVYFPICATRGDFNVSIKRKLPGVRRADIAIVRRCQPYIHGQRNLHRHVLTVLTKLSNADKHRVIQPVQASPGNIGIRIGETTDCIYRGVSPRNPREVLQPGTELGRIFVKKTGPEPYIDMEPRFAIDPSINEFLTLKEFLIKTETTVRHILRAFSKPPKSARAIVGEAPSQSDASV
jgi:hypothetical protein